MPSLETLILFQNFGAQKNTLTLELNNEIIKYYLNFSVSFSTSISVVASILTIQIFIHNK